MVEALNEKLEKAIKKLTTLNEITLKNTRSSHYSFGLEKPAITDRFNITIKLDVDLSVKCQIIFDSRYISSPPDIVFHKLPDINDISSLLPKDDWNLDQEDCLYTWFERILKLLIKKPVILKDAQPKLKRSFFEKHDDGLPNNDVLTKGKKRVHIDDDDDEVFLDDDFLPKARKMTFDDDEEKKKDSDQKMICLDDEDDLPSKGKQKITDDNYDDYHDFDLTHTNKPSLDYKTKFKDDYTNDDDLFFEDDKGKTKSMHDDSKAIKRNYFVGHDEDYMVGKRDKSRVTTKITKNKPFGSIQANLASFSKKVDIFSFPPKSDKRRIGKHTYDDDNDDDIIILPPVKATRNVSPERQTEHRSAVSSPQPKKRIDQRQTKLFDVGSSKGERAEYRKKFMIGWLSKYREHIMVYDTKNYEYFSLLITIKLPIMSDLWAEYKEFKTVCTMELEEKDDDRTNSIVRPKPHAPVVINFKMDPRTFPSSKLKIQLISVMNTTSSGSSEPDSLGFEYQVDPKESVADLIDAIMHFIKDKVPKFHYQLAKV